MHLHRAAQVDAFALAQCVDAGLTVGEIAERLGVTYQTAHYSVHCLQRGRLIGERLAAGEPVEIEPRPHTWDKPQGPPKAAFVPKYRLHFPQVKALHDEGMYPAQIAERTNLSPAWVRHILTRNGIAPHKGQRGTKRGLQDAERSDRIASMYRQGVTLEKIGATFGITRERVRQILAKQGVTRWEGGQSKAAKAKAQVRAAQRDAKSIAKWGLPCEDMKKWTATGVKRAFVQQQINAKARGIEWGLTFAQWLDVWLISGKLEQRGRSKGRYVMSRIKDAGGYVFGNVHVQLLEENSREAMSKWVGKTKKNRGVFLLYPGGTKPWLAKYGKKSLGLFATEEEAVHARETYMRETDVKPHALGKGRGWTYRKGDKKPYQVCVARRYIGTYETAEEARAAYLAAVGCSHSPESCTADA